MAVAAGPSPTAKPSPKPTPSKLASPKPPTARSCSVAPPGRWLTVMSSRVLRPRTRRPSSWPPLASIWQKAT